MRAARDPAQTVDIAAPSLRFRVADWTVDRATDRIIRGEASIKLEPKVMELLVYLAGRPGRVVTREELETAVWVGTVVNYDAIAGSVQKLRRALGDDPREPRFVETIAKRGYRLIAPVQVEAGQCSEHFAAAPTRGAIPIERPPAQRWWRAVGVVVLLLAALPVWVLWDSVRVADGPGSPATPGAPAGPGIVVLPFDNLGGDPGQEYLSHGIAEDLITDLSRVPGLVVIARGSAFSYAGSAEPAQRIGERLGVRYVVKGSVQRLGEELRINAHLIDVATGGTLWAERFEGSMGELFALQDAVAGRVVASLQLSLAAQAGRPAARDYATGIEAYDLFLRAQYQFGRRVPEGNATARDLYRQAIERHPGFARAYAGLALTYFNELLDGYTQTPEPTIAKAAELAEQALALDGRSPHGYFTRALVHVFRADFARALDDLEQALRLRPSYADAYAALGWTLSGAGQFAAARQAVETALRLNPVAPSTYLGILGEIQYMTGRYAEARALLEQVLGINPARHRSRLWLAATYAQLGLLEEAEWEIAELNMLGQEISLARLAVMFPFRAPAHLEHLVEGLRRAGMDL